MAWDMSKFELDKFASSTVGIWPNGNAIKGLLLGMASTPLLLVSMYFFKASPVFFSKEHAISLLAYMCSLFLIGIGVVLYGLPIIIASFQILPIVNQVFIGSFSFKIEGCVSACLTLISLYFAAIGYTTVEVSHTVSWITVVGFAAVIGLSLLRMTGRDRELTRHFDKLKVSDMMCMVLFSFEAAIGFVSICSLGLVFKAALGLVAGLTCMSFLIPIDKGLYYYPATAVVPIFTVFVRIIGVAVFLQMYNNTINTLIIISLFTGIISAFFPLILT